MKLSTIIEALATVCTVMGFAMVSENFLLVGFCVSLTANVLWVVWAHYQKAFGIGIVNLLLGAAAINGIVAQIL